MSNRGGSEEEGGLPNRSPEVVGSPMVQGFINHLGLRTWRSHLCEFIGNFTLMLACLEKITTTVHDRWVRIDGERGAGYLEEDHQGIYLMGVDGWLESKGLEDAIPDVFELGTSEVDTVGDEVHPGVKSAVIPQGGVIG